MKNILILLIISSYSFSQESTFQFGAKGNDAIYDIIVDKNDNIYITGYFQGEFNLIKAKGRSDAFIAKIDSRNSIEWINKLGGKYKRKNEISDYGRKIKIDAKRNVYTIGHYKDSLFFNDKYINHSSQGKQDVFLMKNDTYGNLLWSKSIGNRNNDEALNFAIDSKNNILLYVKQEDTLKNRSFISFLKYDNNGNLVNRKEIFPEIGHWIQEIQPYGNNTFLTLTKSDSGFTINSYNTLNNQSNTKYSSINDIISFSVCSSHNLYILEKLVEVDPNLNSPRYLVKKVSFDDQILWEVESDYLVNSKQTKIISYSKGFSIIGSNSNNLTKLYSTGIVNYDFDGNHLSNFIINNKYQNRIIKNLLKESVLYQVGQFYEEIEFNDNIIKSNGKTDSFINKLNLSDFEVNSISSFKELAMIYPNPNDGEFYIHNVNLYERILVYDLNGKLIHKANIKGNSKIELKNIENTTYFIELYKHDKTKKRFKLIIKK